MLALEVHIACECNAVPRLATVQKVRTLGFGHVWRASAVAAPGLPCSMLEPYTPPTQQPQAAAQLARAGQREPLSISFYSEVALATVVYWTISFTGYIQIGTSYGEKNKKTTF